MPSLAAGRQGLSAQEAGQREEDQDPIDSAMIDKGKAIPELVFPLLKPAGMSMPWN